MFLRIIYQARVILRPSEEDNSSLQGVNELQSIHCFWNREHDGKSFNKILYERLGTPLCSYWFWDE